MNQSSEHKYFPWFTTLFSLLLTVIYVIMSILSGGLKIDFKWLEWFGAPYAVQIYSGHAYGVVANNLIHVSFLHLLVNLVGLWLFGAFLERRIGWFKVAAFGLVSSIFGSMVQLALTNDAGLGISSALFGFYTLILIMSFRDGRFKMKFIYAFGILLFVFLIFMIINNQFFGEEIAVEAKIGGILWGLLMGLSQRESAIKWQLLFVLLLPFSLAASTLLYAPWSSQWQSSRGIFYHKKQDLGTAEKYYKAALKIDPGNHLAKENYNLIKIDRLSVLAYNAHKDGEYTTARRYYLRILALKKNDRWALDNLKELP